MAMMTTPATGVRIGRSWRKAWPKAVAVAPRAMKTTEKPRMKKMEVSATRAVNRPAEPDVASARNWS
ncbi:hypothetical protein D3C86_2258020 [compost metagenome]